MKKENGNVQRMSKAREWESVGVVVEEEDEEKIEVEVRSYVF